MSGYRCILLAVDFSPVSAAAARRGAELARLYEARLVLFHVLEHFPEDLPIGTIVPEDVDPETQLLERARTRLLALAADNGCSGNEIRVTTSTGSARHAIVEQAQALSSDLLVVGAERNEAWVGLGSTAGTLVHHAPCDVLVVRPGEAPDR